MSVLEVEGLKKYFQTRVGAFGGKPVSVRAVDGVSFHIEAGEAFGLVGESGCGKSTVGRAVLHLIQPDAGRVALHGQDLLQLQPAALRALRPKMQMIFQDPYSSLNPKQKVGAALAEPIRVHGLGSGDEADRIVADLLQEVGLPPEAANRYPHEFSGGQRQRIAIARSLTLDPDLIIADEAVSALDVSIQAQILKLLSDIMQRRGLSFLFISHDLGVVRVFCKRLAVMYLGRIVESGPVGPVFDAPMHPYTQILRAASPIPDPSARTELVRLSGEIPSASNPPPGCHFHPRCPFATDLCRTVTPKTIEPVIGRQVACHLHDPAQADAMRETQNLAAKELFFP